MSNKTTHGTNGHLILGRKHMYEDEGYWSGELDELTVWDEVLSEEQITMLYTNYKYCAV